MRVTTIATEPSRLTKLRALEKWVPLFVVLAILQGCSDDDRIQQPTPPTTTPPTTSVDTIAPTGPAEVVATASSSQIDLSWNPASDMGGSGLAGYRIYRNQSTDPLAVVAAPAVTYTDTSVTPDTQYEYVVRAFDQAGNQSPAVVVSATTPPMLGLDARPSNAECVAWARPATASIQLQRFTNLEFNLAAGMLQAPGDNDIWYVLELEGAIRRFNGTGATEAHLYGSVPVTRSGEGGLLGMAFHPDFPTDSRVFVSYTVEVDGQFVSRISSFANSTRTALGAVENVILTIDQPADTHNGGDIHFGPDGYLYIGLGDGGGIGDPWGTIGNGQRLTTMLGKMLRIDVDGAAPYSVPADNPFFDAAAPNDRCPAGGRASGTCPEIYAWGFRNPWRWSFDRDNGELWLGDVGQGTWEEVNVVTSGGNFGWRCREGAHGYLPDTDGCRTAPLINPVAEFDHSAGVAITGGFVYRGSQPTPFEGKYIFGDSGTGRIWAWLPDSATAPRQPTAIGSFDGPIISFGEGNDGELYVVSFDSVHRIVFQPPSGGGIVPTKLSETGCTNPADAKQPAAGLIPYDINAPFWSDGATKRRWIGVPNGQRINVQSDGDWDFPSGTVLMKDFTIGSRLVETRLFVRHADDGSWGGYTYEWNEDQTDATLVTGGAVRTVGDGQQWIFPSEGQCLQCHGSAAGRALGPETLQLNRSFTYAHTNRTANQLTTLSAIGVLAPAITNASTEPKMPDPMDTTAPLADRARAYLHTNCSQCHRPGGPTPSSMDLRYTTALGATNACNAEPQSGTLEIGSAARLIAPGNPDTSVVINRMNRRDANAMPPLGSKQVDALGVALIREWVAQLSGC